VSAKLLSFEKTISSHSVKLSTAIGRRHSKCQQLRGSSPILQAAAVTVRKRCAHPRTPFLSTAAGWDARESFAPFGALLQRLMPSISPLDRKD